MNPLGEGKTLFLRRLEREGRLEEYREALKAYRIQCRVVGETPQPVPVDVMAEFGFLSFVDERMRASADSADALAESLESEMGDLPAVAPASVELDWINGHPAMLRAPDATGMVCLNQKDVNGAAVGPAPSKRAVAALSHWVNHKPEFYRQMMSVQKKETESKDGHSREKTRRDVKELQDIIQDLYESVSRRCTKCGHLIDD